MPITRKQFELEIDREMEEWMKKIHDFLAQHKEEAFSAEELRAFFPGIRLLVPLIVDKERIDFAVALDKLVEIKAIEKRTIRGEDYYAWVGPLIV